MVSFGERKLGDGQPCFITFEAGATHDGVDSAMALIRLAAEAGADAVKFQIFDPDKLVAAKTGMCIQLDTGNASLGEVEQAVDMGHLLDFKDLVKA